MVLKKFGLVYLSSTLFFFSAKAQISSPDTSINDIAPIEIKAYFNAQSMLDLTTSARVVTKKIARISSSKQLLEYLEYNNRTSNGRKITWII
jgi:iron complex outermembrane receptor protein